MQATLSTRKSRRRLDPSPAKPETSSAYPARAHAPAERQSVRTVNMASRDDTILEAKKAKLKPPPMFKVMLLNDDYTPMEFVVKVLQKFFSLSREKATQVMLKVHREGIGICGVFPQDIAATKVQQVAAYSRKHQHPLQCVMEET
jgi:ATP-dependent Clp protease adaptor protein ClpS